MGAGYHGGFGHTKGKSKHQLNTTVRRREYKNKIPNIQHAYISNDKLVGYSLNNSHPSGKDKAKVFKSALGFDRTNAYLLKRQVYQKLTSFESHITKTDKYGTRYYVDIPIKGINGATKIVRTAWIIKTNSKKPTLTSIYVKEN